MNFITNKVEEALGVDLNKDGRIGGPGPMAEVERATHIDMNHDGVIGAYRPTPGGVPLDEFFKACSYPASPRFRLVGKIESATHIDLNHDGRIGGTGAYRH